MIRLGRESTRTKDICMAVGIRWTRDLYGVKRSQGFHIER